MNNIVYHLFCINDGLERFNKTYAKIKNSKLIDLITNVHVNCVGPEKELFSSKISDYHKVIIHLNDYDKSEVTTVNLAQKIAEKNLEGNTLYLHSKGASNKWLDARHNQKKECIDAWVDFMEYHLIEKYEKCLEFLKTYDTCGCNKSRTNARSLGFDWNTWHYSGNFWWSNNKYLQSIPPAKKDHYLWAEALFINGMNSGLGKHKELARSEYTWPQIATNQLDPKKFEP